MENQKRRYTMKRINLETIDERNDYMITQFIRRGVNMEFIKLGTDRYMVKGTNGYVVNEKEKLQLEKNELVMKDITSKDCQAETTKKIKKINKKIKELEEKDETDPKVDDVDDTIEETDRTI